MWECSWIPFKEGLRKPFSAISTHNIYAKDLWDEEDKWDERKIHLLFSDSWDINDILNIYIPHNKIEDKKVWTFTKNKNGQLSTKSTKRWIENYFEKLLLSRESIYCVWKFLK